MEKSSQFVDLIQASVENLWVQHSEPTARGQKTEAAVYPMSKQIIGKFKHMFFFVGNKPDYTDIWY